ncbi:MAG TPA: ABC transporter ATP-binding protein [Coriobacteriia bacterium]
MSAEVKQAVSPPPAPDVRGEGLRMVYRSRTVLDVPAVSLPAGRTYALLGASGAGKSTLLRILGLLERPTAGRVLFDGHEASRHDLARRRTIAAVFQKPYLLRGSVGDNVGYGLRLRRVPPKERTELVAGALSRVGLGGWEDRSALTLSGGEMQRVALARALVLRPGLLLLDEPLSYMDPLLKRQLTIEFAEILAGEHVTALYVTHDQDEAAVVADRIGVMRDGRIVAEGEPESVLTLPPDEWVASFLGTQSPLEGVVTAAEDGVMTVRCGGLDVFAVGDIRVGTEVFAGVRPEDVLLFEPDVEMPRTSARNQVAASVAEVAPAGATVRVVLVAHGVRFAATVSRASAASLGLEFGTRVTALFKATAVRVRPRATLEA